jgi:hypothetical protein
MDMYTNFVEFILTNGYPTVGNTVDAISAVLNSCRRTANNEQSSWMRNWIRGEGIHLGTMPKTQELVRKVTALFHRYSELQNVVHLTMLVSCIFNKDFSVA